VRGDVSKKATRGRDEQRKKGQKLSCIKLAISPDHPRRCSPLTFCMRGHVREIVIYFKFRENRSRRFGAVGVENLPLPLTRPMACTTACTIVQAVILIPPSHTLFFQHRIIVVNVTTDARLVIRAANAADHTHEKFLIPRIKVRKKSI